MKVIGHRLRNGLDEWLKALEMKFPEEQKAIEEYGRDLKAFHIVSLLSFHLRGRDGDLLPHDGLAEPAVGVAPTALLPAAGEATNEAVHECWRAHASVDQEPIAA